MSEIILSNFYKAKFVLSRICPVKHETCGNHTYCNIETMVIVWILANGSNLKPRQYNKSLFLRVTMQAGVVDTSRINVKIETHSTQKVFIYYFSLYFSQSIFVCSNYILYHIRKEKHKFIRFDDVWCQWRHGRHCEGTPCKYQY